MSKLVAPLTGQCLCKAVRYVISENYLKAGLCHCKQCQKYTGSAFYAFIVVPSASIKYTGPLKEFAHMGGSGQWVHRGFCTECGTTLFGRPDVWPVIKTVAASTLDNFDQFSPEMQVWTCETAPWLKLDLDGPQFEQNTQET